MLVSFDLFAKSPKLPREYAREREAARGEHWPLLRHELVMVMSIGAGAELIWSCTRSPPRATADSHDAIDFLFVDRAIDDFSHCAARYRRITLRAPVCRS